MTYTRQYLVTVHGSANMTAEAWQIHTILTSRDNIQPAERVEVVALAEWPTLVPCTCERCMTLVPSARGRRVVCKNTWPSREEE